MSRSNGAASSGLSSLVQSSTGSWVSEQRESQPGALSDISEQDRIDLLERALRQTSGRTPSPSTTLLKTYANELHLEASGSAYCGFRWQVSDHNISDPDSNELPKKLKHSGAFDWIGQEDDGKPKWLWDSGSTNDGLSQNTKWGTVPATEERLKQGYIAVSWTWGRYQVKYHGVKQWRTTTGTKEWQVPKLTCSLSDGTQVDRLTHLKRILKRIPGTRYFWVDVLCINQGQRGANLEEKQAEISKQAKIFSDAKGVIAYLWTLEDGSLSSILSAIGGLLSWSFDFGPDPKVKSLPICRTHSGKPVPGPSPADWDTIFGALRGDHWFSSLWALQEVVLSPAAMWMTQDGGISRLNGRILTTRVFAVAVRLLSLAQNSREDLWKIAEKSYMTAEDLSDRDFEKLKGRFGSEEYELQSAIAEVLNQQRLEKQSQQGYVTNVIVEAPPRGNTPIPWVIQRHDDERDLREKVRQWADWSFGNAGIDVAISATRSAILLAGKNRQFVDNQAQELALLAALKIQRLPPSLSAVAELGKGSPYFSTLLMNVILWKDGVSIFDVLHSSVNLPSTEKPTVEVDTSEWGEDHGSELPYIRVTVDPDKDMVIVEDAVVRAATLRPYLRNNLIKHIPILEARNLLLTGMSPWTASMPNPQVLHFTTRETSVAEPRKGWHFHELGSVHIPPSARTQIITKKGEKTKLVFRPNGPNSEEYPIDRLSDAKLIYQTQDWLPETLGKKPRFLLLPLCIHQPRMLYSRSEDLAHVEEPRVVGVVLVGNHALKPETSMTRWYKFGIYHGWGDNFGTLKWKDGIIVTSIKNEAAIKSAPHGSHFQYPCAASLADCHSQIERTEKFFEELGPKPPS